MTARPARTVAAVAAAAFFLAAAPAVADIAGPNDSIAAAYGPLSPATDVFGAFRRADDIDYASFVVDAAGETLHFDVENTVGRCASIFMNGCPIYASLVDGAGQLLGGAGSSAGTGPVDAGAIDVIDWTFDRAGVFYVVFDSDGDLPTYRARYAVVPPLVPGGGTPAGGGAGSGAGGGTTPGAGGAVPGSGTAPGATGSPPEVAASRLRVRSPQRGPVVTARVKVGRPLRSLRASLMPAGGGPTLGVLRLRDVAAGARTLRVALTRAGRDRLRRRRQLRLRLSLVATPGTGPAATLAQRVTLLGAAAGGSGG